jgi:Zn finger protein HypA/HybF involved in hydrogenase expression
MKNKDKKYCNDCHLFFKKLNANGRCDKCEKRRVAIDHLKNRKKT